MTLTRSFVIRSAIAALPLAVATTAGAQTSMQTKTSTTVEAPDSKTMSSYKKATWDKHRIALKAGTGTSREIPPTDCPPLPAQDCLDTWDDELTANPSR
jgi:hypothetical protein